MFGVPNTCVKATEAKGASTINGDDRVSVLLHRDVERLLKTNWEGADWDNSSDLFPMEVAAARGWIEKQAKQAF